MELLKKRRIGERETGIGFIANMQIYYLIIDLWNWFGSARR